MRIVELLDGATSQQSPTQAVQSIYLLVIAATGGIINNESEELNIITFQAAPLYKFLICVFS